jgi:hypothetical protein
MTDGISIGVTHRRRLRQIWRSAGWPCHDGVEVELLAAGLLERLLDRAGRETLRVTDAGVQLLADALQRNRAAFDAHEALAQRVATEMSRAGRVVWRRLSLRARVGDAWAVALPDVYSIRHTTVEAYVEPIVHEVKVSRADLLSDLRHETKGAAYLQMASQCWYVLREGIAEADEIPAAFGVAVARFDGIVPATLDVLRPAPRRAMSLPFATWMALARSTAEPIDDADVQRWLGDVGDDSAQ